jgi:hypothetical protein
MLIEQVTGFGDCQTGGGHSSKYMVDGRASTVSNFHDVKRLTTVCFGNRLDL